MPPSLDAAAVRRRFAGRFPGVPRLVRAPGRINLIGEHTDYNDGWVMPAAIDLAAWVAVGARDDRRLVLSSEEFDETAAFDLDAPADLGAPAWSRSLGGVARLLERGGHHLRGANLLLASEIPVGAGLSSSAAVEVACGFALLLASGLAVDRPALARMCQQASHEFAGTRCGIMDPYIVCHGHEGTILKLDTRSLEAAAFPWPAGLILMVGDTMVQHDHATGGYNQRRAECEAAVARLARELPGLTSLRDLDAPALERHADALDAVLLARCRHVVSENARVHAAAAALGAGDDTGLGQLLNASHASLRDDYEVSCFELDLMAALFRAQPGVYGARMMGGGFGGSVLGLAHPAQAAAAAAAVTHAYAERTGLAPVLRCCRTADGVQEITEAHEHAPAL